MMTSQFLINLGVWHWFALCLVVIIFELILLNSGFLLWIALAAGIVGLITLVFPGLTALVQLLLFGLIAVICGVIGQLYFSKENKSIPTHYLNRRSEQYIGRHFILEQPIVNGVGTIRVDDTLWRVKGNDLPSGSKIIVTGTEGVFLLVSKIE